MLKTSTRIRRCLLAGCTLTVLLVQAAAQSQPVVTGNTITVPDDGWYQFQSAMDFSTVCQGVLSCTVSPGRYIVINHTTQERFEKIDVAAQNVDNNEISVNGNTISWPAGDWYQVQSSDFVSLCNGGTSCEVSAGTYIVINHSTGKRYDEVKVPSDTVAPIENTGITLTGNTISWEGDDWYQIQSSTDYATVCEGGNSCEVSPGTYIVINHSTGTRIDDFEVGGNPSEENETVPGQPANLRGSVYSKNQLEIFWDAASDDGMVVGYDVVRNGVSVAQSLDARSYFESSLASGTVYNYQVIAIDDQGNRSTASEVQLTTQGESSPQQDERTVAAALAPVTDNNNQVSWAFAPVDSGLTLDIEPFVVMPLASNGKPARWNDMATLGDRIFVVDEQDGRLYEITNGQATLWFDIGAAVQSSTGRSLNTDNAFHGGVRGIAFHPDFSNNGRLYSSLMEQRPVDPTQHHYLSDAAMIDADSVLVEWTVNTDTFVVDASSYREVFRVGIPEYDHPIKQIAFDPSASSGSADYGLLYIAHGDGSKESTTAVGGQGNNALGKILRINPLVSGSASYSIPGSNPFVGDGSMLDAAFSIGHRNPHHPAFMNDGTLLVTEDGRDNIDEVNLIVAGADYGWSMREGAYVQLGQAGLVTGVGTLPDNDADFGFTYPVAQFGHTGNAGSGFTGQALGGGFVMENGSELDGQYFYIDFPKSGEIFHSTIDAIRAATTRGAPANLSVAKTGRASVRFDHDSDDSTSALNNSMREIIRSASGYGGGDRVDIRFGQGPQGELYLLNKRNNVVYLISNSLPANDD